ncbi:MAG: hypothetical protein ACRDV2_02750 [Actinomycetes bacterium]
MDDITRQLAVAAEAGGEDARALAERLVAPLEAAVRLALLDALSVAAGEITVELAPGSVELRLRGGEPSFAVQAPPTEPGVVAVPETEDGPAVRSFDAGGTPGSNTSDDAGQSTRINLRLSDALKVQVEEAASRQGRSVNAWLVRAATSALQTAEPGHAAPTRGHRGPQHFTGWVQ